MLDVCLYVTVKHVLTSFGGPAGFVRSRLKKGTIAPIAGYLNSLEEPSYINLLDKYTSNIKCVWSTIERV